MTAFAAQADEPLRPSDHVELVIAPADAGASCPYFPAFGDDARAFNRRLYSDGTAAPFAVPSGQVLVVTSLIARNATAAVPGARVIFRVIRFAPDNNLAFNEPVLTIFFADSDGEARFRAEFSPGLVVRSGTQLCMVALHSGSTNLVSGASLQGYLARDR